MAVPAVKFAIATPTFQVLPPAQHVVFVLAVRETGGNAADNRLYYATSAATVRWRFGADSKAAKFAEAVFNQVRVTMVLKTVVANASVADVTTAFGSFSDSVFDADIIYLADGYTTSPGFSQNAYALKLNQLCMEYNCFGVMDTPYNSLYGAAFWASANAFSRTMPIFNRVKDADGNLQLPSGYWLGAVLANTETKGHQRSIDYAPVDGVHGLEYEFDAGSNAFLINSLGASGIGQAHPQPGFFVMGSEFRAVPASNPRRHWHKARVIQLVVNALRKAVASLIGKSLSISRASNSLQSSVYPLVRDRIIENLEVLPIQSVPWFGGMRYTVRAILTLIDYTETVDIKLEIM